MDKKYLIDTNIIIYYMDNKIPDSQLNFIESIFQFSFNISTITKIELLGWHGIDNVIRKKIESFLKNARVFYIDQNVENMTIKIKQSNKIPVPDAVIAATSIINNLTLVTRNTKDFVDIADLSLFNPFS